MYVCARVCWGRAVSALGPPSGPPRLWVRPSSLTPGCPRKYLGRSPALNSQADRRSLFSKSRDPEPPPFFPSCGPHSLHTVFMWVPSLHPQTHSSITSYPLAHVNSSLEPSSPPQQDICHFQLASLPQLSPAPTVAAGMHLPASLLPHKPTPHHPWAGGFQILLLRSHSPPKPLSLPGLPNHQALP